MNMHLDRRKKRSQGMQQSLDLQLDASRERLRSDSLVLADDVGLLIAEAGDKEECEEVAALAPHLAHGKKVWSGRIRWRFGMRQVTVSPFKIGASLVFLCALRGNPARMDPVLSQTREGVRRILSR